MADSGPGLLPPLPTQFQQYNSYEVDPMWQRRFSAIWAALAGVAILISLPRLFKSIRNGRALASHFGIWEDFSGKNYEAIDMNAQTKGVYSAKKVLTLKGILSTIVSFTLWSPPYISLTVGQMLVIFIYIIVVLICITMDAQLITNPNRGGFMALAQLPVVFLLGTKNSVLSLLLGPGFGWERLNYIHRWSGRGLFLAAAVHGSLWIRNHLVYDIPIIGQQKETSGVAAFGLLCVIVITSFRVVRYWAYQFFFIVHVLGFVAFFITICYHTPYASPWIFPPLAFYGLDMLLRLLRYRIKDASLIPIGNQMTIIQVNDCSGGWVAGQHVRLRVFFGGRVFESHPLTILSASPRHTCLSNRSLMFGARANGDWSKALNSYALAHTIIRSEKEKQFEGTSDWPAHGVPINVMIDGPYGGCSIDLGDYESVLLVGGGSGATFCIGLLDDILGRCIKLGRNGGERTKRIEFSWCTRSFGNIMWFAPLLQDLAYAAAKSSIDLHITIYITCLCEPEKVPIILNCDVIVERPSMRAILAEFISPPATETTSLERSKRDALGGGVGVCVAGPESLNREACNAVAGVALTKGRHLGGIELHTEVYAV